MWKLQSFVCLLLLSIASCKKENYQPRTVEFTIKSAEPVYKYEINLFDKGFDKGLIKSVDNPDFQMDNYSDRKYLTNGSFTTNVGDIVVISVYRKDGFTLRPTLSLRNENMPLSIGRNPEDKNEDYVFTTLTVK